MPQPEDNGDPLNPASKAYAPFGPALLRPDDEADLMTVRQYVAAQALKGLLAYHGCGYDPYHRREDGRKVDEEDPYVQQIRDREADRRAENKVILAREAFAYADAWLARHNAAQSVMVPEDDGQAE